MGPWEHGVEQILAEAGIESGNREKNTFPANVNVDKKGRCVQPKQKTRKKGHNFNRFILRRARERATQNRDKIPMGPSRG